MFACEGGFVATQYSVERCTAGSQELVATFGDNRMVFLFPGRNPLGEHGLHAFSAGLIHGKPEFFEGVGFLGVHECVASTLFFSRGFFLL